MCLPRIGRHRYVLRDPPPIADRARAIGRVAFVSEHVGRYVLCAHCLSMSMCCPAQGLVCGHGGDLRAAACIDQEGEQVFLSVMGCGFRRGPPRSEGPQRSDLGSPLGEDEKFEYVAVFAGERGDVHGECSRAPRCKLGDPSLGTVGLMTAGGEEQHLVGGDDASHHVNSSRSALRGQRGERGESAGEEDHPCGATRAFLASEPEAVEPSLGPGLGKAPGRVHPCV